MRFTLYPISWVADPHLDPEPFDHNLLPFDVTENVRIESLEGRFRPDAFALGADRHGAEIRENLEEVRYALVHRYDPRPVFQNGEYVGDLQFDQHSEILVREVMACLRLVRPMRARALVIKGGVREADESFDVTGYDIPPLHLLEVPEVQKLFKLRNQDCLELRRYAPLFRQAMAKGVWKFKMAVQFHELGHFQCLDWKARCLLWGSAIESIFTTNSRNHQGTTVATERIKWFLGENTSIYAPGDLTEFDDDPHITVGDMVKAWYNVRNHLAHGDRIPDIYFMQEARHAIGGAVNAMEFLIEGASFLIRSSLLKILRDGLLHHFVDAAAAESYFDANNLTNSKIRARQDAAVLAGRP
jgi:hypothetical protein